MQQIKLFKGIEGEPGQLEERINAWIREHSVKVIQMTGNIAQQTPPADETAGVIGKGFASSDILVVILYETADDAG